MLPKHEEKAYIQIREEEIRKKWANYQEGESLQQTFTPLSLTYEMLQKLPSLEGKDVLVLTNIETVLFLSTLKRDGYVNFNKLHFLTDIKKLEGKEGVSYISFDELDKVDLGMKFDVVIGNPPYNQGNTGVNKTIYHKFIELSVSLSKKFVTLVVPGGYIISRGRKFVPTVSAMNSFGVESITYLDSKDYWNHLSIINLNYFLLNKDSEGKVEDFLNISEEDRSTIEEAKGYSDYLKPFRGGQAYEHSDCVEEIRTSEFNTPHITRVRKEGPVFRFSNKKPVEGNFLIVMSERFSGYNPVNIFIVEGSHSLSANVIAFSASTMSEAKRLKTYLESNRIQKYVKAFKGTEVGPFKLADIRKIPNLS